MSRTIIYCGFLAFVIALSGCSKGQKVDEPGGGNETRNAVGVSLADEDATRANVNHTTSKDQILRLGVFGYDTGNDTYDSGVWEPNILSNQLVTRTASTADWVYDPVAYWPVDKVSNCTFFAYAPYRTEFPLRSAISLSQNDKGDPIIYYATPTKVSEQIDILYSDPNPDTSLDETKGVRDITAEANGGMVKFYMKHALVWVRFIITSDPGTNTDAKYYLYEFNLSGEHVPYEGDFNLATGKWDPSTYVVGRISHQFDDISDLANNGTPFEINAGEVRPFSDHYAMLIPEDVVQATDETTVNFIFAYHDGEVTTDQYYVSLPFPDVMLSGLGGNIMTYIVKLSTAGAAIEFLNSSTIENWEQDNESDNVMDVF